jgi:hypothetical protein
MKKITLSLVLIFIVQLFFGQERTTMPEGRIEFGKPHKVVNAKVKKKYFTFSGGILAVKASGGKVTLQTYSKDGLIQLKINSYVDFPDGFLFEDCVELGGRFLMFYSNWDREYNKQQLFMREIDKVSSSFIGDEKMVFNIDGKLAGSNRTVTEFFSRKRFDFSTSYKKNKLLILYRHKGNLNVKAHVYDSYFNLVWNRFLDSNLDRMIIDSYGSVYSFTFGIDPEKTEINLMKYDGDDSESLDLKKVRFSDNMKINAKLIEAENGVVIVGHYTTMREEKVSPRYGIIYFDLEKVYSFSTPVTGSIKNSALVEVSDEDVKYYDIPKVLINQFLNHQEINIINKKMAKGQWVVGLSNLIPIKLHKNKEGDMFIIGEQQYSVIKTYQANTGQTIKNIYYFYEHLLITKLDKDGHLLWMKKLPKKQSNSKIVETFKLINGDENIHLIYTDNIKNLKLKSEAPMSSSTSSGYLTDFSINKETGDFKKIFLFDTEKIGKQKIYKFQLSGLVSFKNDEFIFEVYKKKQEDVLIKIDLK